MKWKFWRHSSAPSEEAVKAQRAARAASDRADVLYGERRRMLDENHFAERIRLIYEGR